MKVTGFTPMVATTDAAAAIALFESLGFKKAHMKDAGQGGGFDYTTFKDENGFTVDVVDGKSFPRDFALIRVNVDDFDEAYDMLMARGFRKGKGFPENRATTSSKFAILVSPSGFIIDLCQHIK